MKKGITLPTVWWADIKGYEGLYKVSINGEVKSLNYRRTGQERILKPGKNRKGYLQVNLCKNGEYKMRKIHRLVAQAWLPNPDNKPQINHIDEDKTNNHVDNLEWVTPKENCNFGTRNERMSKAKTNGKTSKAVMALDKKGRVVHVFPSMKEAGRNGFNSGAISDCCRGKYKTHHGLVWLYRDDFLKKIS